MRAYGPAAAYCPRCAAPLVALPPTACTACGYALFVNPRPTGLVIAVEGSRFLAVRRGRAPRAGAWSLPGGFCDGWESPAAAAEREAREELGVTVTLGQLVGMYVGTYEFQDERIPVLDCVFAATLGGADFRPNPAEVSRTEWFDLDNPPGLAFPTLNSAMSDARQIFAR